MKIKMIKIHIWSREDEIVTCNLFINPLHIVSFGKINANYLLELSSGITYEVIDKDSVEKILSVIEED